MFVQLNIWWIPKNFIISFLSEKTQRFKLDDTHSESLNITCGVPLSTVLGPLLLIIYSNDLLKLHNDTNIELFSFADDSTTL